MSATAQKNILPQSSELAQQQEAQRLRALNPAQSVWVSASAGSGKTTLLTQRVLRLLLQNRIEKRTHKNKVLPNILCLTYTKAAAAEMQNRIRMQLQQWAILPEGDLQNRLEETFALKTNPTVLKEARRLFAFALERPDAIRIMTMHAFCQMILNRFPHEAGLAPHFTLLEGEAEKLFHEQVLSEFYGQIKTSPALNDALTTLGYSQATSRTKEMLGEVFKNSGKWAAHFAAHPTPENFAKSLQTKLNLVFIGSERELLEQQSVPENELLQAADWLQAGSKTDKERGVAISKWVHDKQNRAPHFDEYALAYLTTEETVRAKLFTKDIEKNNPSIADILNREAQRVLALVQTRNALRFYHQHVAFYILAQHLWQLVKDVKRRNAQLTYDDLILTTRDVFTQPELAPWVLYKLDGGIDHILIDEAQDTSPEQWDIIFALLDEVLSGRGAREDEARTLFVVGDEKQSIYSFQGANHRHYLEVKAQLFARFKHLLKPMIEVDRIQSFRSTSAVLEFVDEVFRRDEIRKGVSNTALRHYPYRAMRGMVELWSPVKTEMKPLPQPWEAPLERDDSKHAYVRLAQRIADTIATWLSQSYQLKTREGQQRAVKPDDIIILLQRRSHLLSPIIRALKERNIPVAGIDRMVLHKQPAVQDVLSLCRFLLLPQDDLTLAEVLRGPFIRISDEQLFAIAHRRSGSLWQALQDTQSLNTICDYLKHLLAKVDTVSSFALLSHIFVMPCPGNPAGGKTALIHRLGMDAIDPLEQLLSAARQHDAQHPLSLQLFVRAIAQDDSELKREQSEANCEVRIMTTHGAKGLEAPIIIMPDLMRDPHKQGKQPSVFWDSDGFVFPATPVAKKVPAVEACKAFSKEARDEEHRRLLYVALTRAADVLILCSAIKDEEAKPQPWQAHIQDAMNQLAADATELNGEPIWKFGDVQTLSPPVAPVPNITTDLHQPPAWLLQPIPPISAKQPIYNPSMLQRGDETQLSPSASGTASSFMRGRLLHRLLQLLPNIPDDQREEAAARFLIQSSGSDRDVMLKDVQEVMAVLRNPVFADVFSKDAQAEVPIIGTINGKYFSGQIDRLLVTDTEVLVIDFKTNRPPPRTTADVEHGYAAQMACYKILLEQIYKGRKLRAGLLWTHNLTLMELDDASLQRGMRILDNLSS
ncbi:MAG: double-strand break repair helicase AddA [Alphaproteobacteria bacterium]|nr:double-strand break repair helicase AddA [Alphaproteobacteria bacterium]